MDKNTIPVTTLYRIQGGTFPNKSRNRITVEDGNISTTQYKTVYVGDKEHMAYFLFKRLGIPYSNNVSSIQLDINEKDAVHVIEMIVPYWVTNLFEKYAIAQSVIRNEKNYIYLADLTTPGKSYGIKGTWSSLLVKTCLVAREEAITNVDNLINILLPKDNGKFSLSNLSMKSDELKKILIECGVHEDDITRICMEFTQNVVEIKEEQR